MAATRGRDARALRRPGLARRRHPPRDARARRRTTALPVAWAIAHLGFGLDGLRLFSAPVAVASLVATAALVARLTDRRTALLATRSRPAPGCSSSRGCSAGCTACSCSRRRSPRSPSCARSTADGAATGRSGSLADARCGRNPPLRRSRPRRTGLFVLLAHRRQIRRRSWPSQWSLVAGTPFWLTDLVLAGRFDVGVGGGGSNSAPRAWSRSISGGSPATWPPAGRWALLPCSLVAAVGLLSMRREALHLHRSDRRRAGRGLPGRPPRQHRITADPSSDLHPAVLRHGGGHRSATARPRAPVLVVAAAVALLIAEGAWTKHRTPTLVERRAAGSHRRAPPGLGLARRDVTRRRHPVRLRTPLSRRVGAKPPLPNTVVPRADPCWRLGTSKHARASAAASSCSTAATRTTCTRTGAIEANLPNPQAAFEVQRVRPIPDHPHDGSPP